MDEKTQGQPIVSETATDAVVSSSAPETPVTSSDPSLNCPECSGSGLLNETSRCTKCQGTGKATDQASQYPEGTQVITADGTFNVVNGELVKQE